MAAQGDEGAYVKVKEEAGEVNPCISLWLPTKEVNRTLGKATLAAVPELQKRASDEHAQQRSGVRRYGSYQNEDGSTLSATASCKVKAPKFSGDVDFEAFRAQFELLACLLMLTPVQRRSYRELVAALDRRFGKDKHRELALSALGRRQRMPGEPLRALANYVERLTLRAYGHTPPVVQDELARDRFVLALSPPELRARTQLACPLSLLSGRRPRGENTARQRR
ncbi:hypothetical protein DPEC_G00004610 [Dallia pectoralis]|uniref:Uncharacterized protein n=1 Tax=Dallia pectoralis TaxID=75939 RepID=A0ACC2HJQ0_DALPE|nr:hypothetical protein DPEC_G00004610 [Dallia pectoralis]